MLGTNILTLTAAHTIGCLGRPLGKTLIEHLGTEFVTGIEPQSINSTEDIGYADAHRATVGTIAAGCTGYKISVEHLLLDLINEDLLILREGLKIRESLDVVVHLIFRGHARKDSLYTRKRAYEPQSPRSGGSIRSYGLELAFEFGSKISERSSLYGLHDDHGDITAVKDLIEFSRSYNRVVPVGIVELDLNELSLGMSIENFLEELGSTVERESKVPYLALFLLLESP